MKEGEWFYHELVCRTTSRDELERACEECEGGGCDACFWLAWCYG